MKFVYILQSEDGERFYVGVSDDVHARLDMHNAGKVRHTRKFKPWKLRTFIAFSDHDRAFDFECY